MITSSRRVFMGVDRRVVLCRPTLQLPPPRPTRLQLIKLLTGLGFGHVDFPIATIAKELVGKPYLREARMSDAPNAFTCSTLVRHLYAMRGIWIPRFVEQQYEFGRPVENMHAGDLVFRSATDGSAEPYHVGIMTKERTVIHAAGRGERAGVQEIPLATFKRSSRFLVTRRIVDDWDEIETFIVTPRYEIETSDDLNILVRRLIMEQRSS